MREAAVYVHLPFCPYICPYCDFAKWPHRRSAEKRYLEALFAEVEDAPKARGTTLFFGGGTPNTIDTRALVALVERLRMRFEIPEGAEITLEANPDRALCGAFAAYRSAGISRLSLGVQSFDERELRILGRRHTAADVTAAVEAARRGGFEDLSLDLIFGIPGGSLASWERSLDAALALRPEHISTYGLTVEPGTPLATWYAREPGAFPSSDVEAEQYRLAIEKLGAAGYEQYEISNFARPGHRSRHNQNYWANGEYIGLGVGAASYLDRVRSVHTRDLDAYVRAALARTPIPGESEQLGPLARLGEATMLALRTTEGVDLESFHERYEVDFLRHYERQVRELESGGMLEVRAGRVRLTLAGRFVANDVCSAFIA
ncbi:MAG: radical SAM family heme chaperone HemW [Candidatus Eremiobacteraeota bacterium]|nr:radical SAM family heme chaperone HemW [Candidatus Eremiobacteraeota bacterium]MBV8354152.1 radical SAM family heme chaperone HemW [Candidatus Eremiobacteraeota bacterium]